MDGPAVNEPARFLVSDRTLRGLKGAPEQRSRCLMRRHGVHTRYSRAAMVELRCLKWCTVFDYKREISRRRYLR